MSYGPAPSGYPDRCECGATLVSGSCPRCSPPVRLEGIKDGIAGTAEIIARMRELVLDSYRDERVNQLARQIVSSCASHDHACEAAALLSWMQRTFKYTRLPWHPGGFQRIQTPSYTLFDAPVRSGECASLSTALGALLMSLGFEIAFRTAGSDMSRPNDFEHVYVMANIPGKGWTAAEPSYDLPIGAEHPASIIHRDWSV